MESLNINQFHNDVIKYNAEILEYFHIYKENRFSEILSINKKIIGGFLERQNSIKELNKLGSILFNPLNFFYIGETLHSQILAFLLNPNSEHGQGILFLKTFLKSLKIEVHESENWIITAEKGKVDILLKRNHPHAVVIIENKSNFAGDQENQLYRYWYQQIYLPNEKRFGNKALVEIKNNQNNYCIIYFTPADWKLPSDQTLMKPTGQGYDENAPSKVPTDIIIWNYNNQVVNWLEQSIEKLNPNNYRLREFIHQYIELWKNN